MRPVAQWRIHYGLIAVVTAFSFVLNQLPLVLSSRSDSLGADGDSGFHASIQMKLRDPALFPKDVELNEIYMKSRPAFEFAIHRTVGRLAEWLFGGNLFAANIAAFWTYHLFFIVGCYCLGLFVLESPGGAALFAAASVGLSLGLFAWWGMVYGAVLPKDLSLSLVPWFMLGYLRWADHPRRLLGLFFLLGLAVNLYPLQPAYLALVFLAITFFRRHPRVLQCALMTGAFILSALPSVLLSAGSALQRQAALSPADRAAVDALFVRHYGYLLLANPLETLRMLATTPVWWFLGLAVIALLLQRRAAALAATGGRLALFTLWTAALALAGLGVGAAFRPLVTFLFHRSSALLYVPAYLGTAWLALYALRRRTRAGLAAGMTLALLLLGMSARNTTLVRSLRGVEPLQTSEAYYALADWAAASTPAGSLFMVPYQGRTSYFAFRAYSGRGVLAQYATGEIVISYPQSAALFWQLTGDVAPLYARPSAAADFTRVARKYDVDYIVTDAATPQLPDLPIAYHNEAFTVFVVPPASP